MHLIKGYTDNKFLLRRSVLIQRGEFIQRGVCYQMITIISKFYVVNYTANSGLLKVTLLYLDFLSNLHFILYKNWNFLNFFMIPVSKLFQDLFSKPLSSNGLLMHIRGK